MHRGSLMGSIIPGDCSPVSSGVFRTGNTALEVDIFHLFQKFFSLWRPDFYGNSLKDRPGGFRVHSPSTSLVYTTN